LNGLKEKIMMDDEMRTEYMTDYKSFIQKILMGEVSHATHV